MFHGVVSAIATRTSFEMVEGRQEKVCTIDVFHSIILRERQREETIRQEKKHEEAYDGRHLGFSPRVMFVELYLHKLIEITHKLLPNVNRRLHVSEEPSAFRSTEGDTEVQIYTENTPEITTKATY